MLRRSKRIIKYFLPARRDYTLERYMSTSNSESIKMPNYLGEVKAKYLGSSEEKKNVVQF